MSRRHVGLFALVFVAALSSANAADVDHNGQWWREQRLPAKYQYAGGLFNGLTVGSNLLEFGMSAQVLVKPETQVREGSVPQKYVRFDGGQLIEGLDKFYADPRNTKIPISKASRIFVYSVAGAPRDELLRLVEEYRKPGC